MPAGALLTVQVAVPVADRVVVLVVQVTPLQVTDPVGVGSPEAGPATVAVNVRVAGLVVLVEVPVTVTLGVSFGTVKVLLVPDSEL